MVADLTLLWGIIPGRDPERRKAYQKVWKKIEEAVKRYNLDPGEVYFIYGQLRGDETEATKQRAFEYIREHRPELIDVPKHLEN